MFFQQTGFRSFNGLLLNDEEGKLGILAFFRKKTARPRGECARSRRHPRQPGHRRGPQRPALQAGAAARVPEAAGGEAPAIPGDPQAAAPDLGSRASRAPGRPRRRALAAESRGGRPDPSGQARDRDRRRGRNRQFGPPPRGRHGPGRRGHRDARPGDLQGPRWRTPGPLTRSRRAKSFATRRRPTRRTCSRPRRRGRSCRRRSRSRKTASRGRVFARLRGRHRHAARG